MKLRNNSGHVLRVDLISKFCSPLSNLFYFLRVWNYEEGLTSRVDSTANKMLHNLNSPNNVRSWFTVPLNFSVALKSYRNTHTRTHTHTHTCSVQTQHVTKHSSDGHTKHEMSGILGVCGEEPLIENGRIILKWILKRKRDSAWFSLSQDRNKSQTPISKV